MTVNETLHSLITAMRKAGVKAITVWDVKGERPWKLKEHARRELVRQLHMSRVLHEDQRQVRLGKVQRLLGTAARLQEGTSTQTVRFLHRLVSIHELIIRQTDEYERRASDHIERAKESYTRGTI